MPRNLVSLWGSGGDVVPSAGGGSAWAFVSASANVNDTPAVTKNVTAGDLIIVGYASGSAGSNTPTISDGVNSWTQITTSPLNDPANAVTMATWWAIAATTASITATISGGGATFNGTWMEEWSFAGATFGADGSNKAINVAGTTSGDGELTGSVTTTLNGDLILSFILDATALRTSTQFTAGTGFTKRATASSDPGGASALTFAVEDMVQTSAGAINPPWTATTTDGYDGITACFKKA